MTDRPARASLFPQTLPSGDPDPDPSFRNRGEAFTAACCSRCRGRSLCHFLCTERDTHVAMTRLVV